MDNEQAFRKWYAGISKQYNLDPDPDSPKHFYDYRAAFKAGANPDLNGHWPSKFKTPGHPNRIVNGIDTVTGKADLYDLNKQLLSKVRK